MIRRCVSATRWPLAMLVGLFVVGKGATAQSPPRDQPRTSTAGTGVIRGRVVRADTGEPLRRVQVRVDEWSTTDRSGPAATMTDADGRYELMHLAPGRYQLKATRGDYVEVAYGQRRPFERGRPVELRDGAVLQNIDFALPRGAVVTGRVVDEAGEAVARASVSLARRRYVDGERRLVGESGTSTDDRGQFRMFGVAPGDYVVIAKLDVTDFGSTDRVRYVPTYYPGTPVASEAQRITVALGQELSGIAITLARTATASVQGVVRSSGDAAPGLLTFVTARQIDAERVDEMATAVAAADGSFTLAGLLPGTYVVEARSTPGPETASLEVGISGADVTGVTLMLSRGATARGRIRFDTDNSAEALRPSEVFVTPILVDGHVASMEISGGPPSVRDDWSFELSGLRGRGFIRAGTVRGWEVKRVLREGVDVTDTPLDFSLNIDNLEVELTRRVTSVSGGVLDEHGAVALDATVIVFADDPQKWGPRSRFIASGRPDQRGRFTLGGLPPGRYVAIAVGYLEPGDERDSDLLTEWRRHGTSFVLSEGENLTLDLSLSNF